VVSLVTRVRDTAGGLYQQARDKYSDSEAMQRATRQASEKAGQAAGRARDLAGKQARDLAGKSRSAAGRASTAVRGFHPRDIKIKGITGK
jgi:hypothetical protein